MFLSRYKDRIIDKYDALVGRDNPLNELLIHEINGRDINLIPEGYKSIILGMGCFWGAEKIFWNLNGIYHTSVGYSGGHTKNPTYEEVCSGLTGHTEVVRLVYDPQKIELLKILILFWEGHNPTQGMRQGNDIGTQYRSAIFINCNEDLKFYFAEIYHQQYLYKNPNGYCGLGGCGVKFN